MRNNLKFKCSTIRYICKLNDDYTLDAGSYFSNYLEIPV
jgi:hypothetical protein